VCFKVQSAQCSASVVGFEIELESEAVLERTSEICGGVCDRAAVSCALEELVPGSYNVTYGDRSLVLDIPGKIA